jgi:4'-phosphopantetheinyl transferase
VTGSPFRAVRGGLVAAHPVAGLPPATLPVADRAAARNLAAHRAREYLAARVLLRWLLRAIGGAAAAGADLAFRPRGQPYLVQWPDLGVSISHSDGWVAAAVLPGGRIGVDVQTPVDADARMLARCCTASAWRALAALPGADRAGEFAWIWSVQEACVKATGDGIAGRPWTVPVEVGQRTGRWGALDWSELRDGWPVAVSCAILSGRQPPCQCAG